MYKHLTLLSLALCGLSACQTTPNNSQNTPDFRPFVLESDNSQWRYIADLSDEFNDQDIDKNKWTNDPYDWGTWSWEPDNTWQAEGKLNIQMRYEEHQAKRWVKGTKLDADLYYKSGIVRSHAYQTYGYYEVRMKGIPTFPGSSPAFWIYSLNEEIQKMGLKGSKEGEVTYSEVDIVELQQAEWIHGSDKQYDGANIIDMNLHTRIIENGKEVWKRPGKFHELTRNKITADFDARDDFHIYGANVTPEKITWYIDGIQVAEKPNLYWHLPMHVTLSLGLRRPHVTYNNCASGFDSCPVVESSTPEGYPSAMQVDWVRVYQPL
jgi:beta-glucanase (GH16 family)